MRGTGPFRSGFGFSGPAICRASPRSLPRPTSSNPDRAARLRSVRCGTISLVRGVSSRVNQLPTDRASHSTRCSKSSRLSSGSAQAFVRSSNGPILTARHEFFARLTHSVSGSSLGSSSTPKTPLAITHIQVDMGILDRLTDWLETPSQPYRCESCGTRFEETQSSCPECGGEVRQAPPVEYPFWEPY